MPGKAYKLLVLFLIWFVYITIGVFIFKAVEGNDNIDSEKTNAELLEKLKQNITANYNMSGSEFDNIVQQIQEVSSSSSGPEWSYSQTISFIAQLLTTIGKLALCNTFQLICLSFFTAKSITISYNKSAIRWNACTIPGIGNDQDFEFIPKLS